jgi:hypothetical protein
MIITDCKTCAAPVARSMWRGIGTLLDMTALDYPALARTWIAGVPTYIVHTRLRSQEASYYPASPHNIAEVLQRAKDGSGICATVLAVHQCPQPLMFVDEALNTWQSHDAAPHRPAPARAVVSEGIPF